MLGSVELETIIHDNSLPAVIQETGQTWLRVRLTDAQTDLSESLTMGPPDFADLILSWRAHGCHAAPYFGQVASPAEAENP